MREFKKFRFLIIYFNFILLKLQEKVIDLVKFWCNQKIDGLYLKNWQKIIYKNAKSIEELIKTLREICFNYQIKPKILIGDLTENSFLNSLFDIYRVRIETLNFNSSNPFEYYLNQEKNIIWSLENLDSFAKYLPTRRENIKAIFFILYSLPGIVLIKQSDELEYENVWQKNAKIFRWDDLSVHSGFSNLSQDLNWLKSSNNLNFSYPTSSQSLLKEFGIDLKHALNQPDSLLNFLRFLNLRIKKKLIDIRPQISFTKPYPILNKIPQPFKNSYKSFSNIYLSQEKHFKIENQNFIFKVTRQINSNEYLNAKYYRNLIFALNLSPRSILLDQIVFPSTRSLELHVVLDSSNTLPDYADLNSFYLLKPFNFICIEF